MNERQRTVIMTFRDRQTVLPFTHPVSAEVYMHLLPQMIVDGNKDVEGLVSARLGWAEWLEAEAA